MFFFLSLVLMHVLLFIYDFHILEWVPKDINSSIFKHSKIENRNGLLQDSYALCLKKNGICSELESERQLQTDNVASQRRNGGDQFE